MADQTVRIRQIGTAVIITQTEKNVKKKSKKRNLKKLWNGKCYSCVTVGENLLQFLLKCSIIRTLNGRRIGSFFFPETGEGAGRDGFREAKK